MSCTIDRRLLAAAVGALLGCNSILGLDQTHPQDAPVYELPPDAPDAPTTQGGFVTRLVADMNADGTPLIDRSSPVATDPMARLALVDEPLGDPVPYANAQIQIPLAYAGKQWRMQLVFAGVAHEYQWMTDTFHVTSPIVYGHADPAPAVPGASYVVSTTPAQPLGNIELVSSGVWFDAKLGAGSSATATVPWNEMQGEPLVGRFGTPEKSRGDWQVLIQREDLTTMAPTPDLYCRRAAQMGWTQVDPTAMNTSATFPWNTPVTPWPFNTDYTGDNPNRFTNNVPPASSTGQLAWFGYVPKMGVPEFLRPTPRPELTLASRTDKPLMVPLGVCKTLNAAPNGSQIEMAQDPAFTAKMAAANYGELTSSRTVEQYFAVSSLQAISLDANVVFAAPLARNIVVHDTTDLTLSSTGPDFSTTIDPMPERRELVTWEVENNAAATQPHDWEVTLFGFYGTNVSPVYVWHVFEPKLVLDTSVFARASGTKRFLLRVRARNFANEPGESKFDLSVAHYPFATSTVWTYGFKIP